MLLAPPAPPIPVVIPSFMDPVVVQAAATLKRCEEVASGAAREARAGEFEDAGALLETCRGAANEGHTALLALYEYFSSSSVVSSHAAFNHRMDGAAAHKKSGKRAARWIKALAVADAAWHYREAGRELVQAAAVLASDAVSAGNP